MLSGSVLGVPSAISLRLSHGLLPSHCRPSCTVSFQTISVFGARFALRRGVSPDVGPVGALGELRWLHLYRLTPDLVGLLLFAGCLGVPVGVFCLLCDIPPVFMAIFWSVSLTPAFPLRVPPMRGCSLETCVACTWLDLMSSSALFQDSVICADFWSRQYGPHTTCDRLRWRWPCLPRLRWFDPLLLRCAWWSSGPGWLLNVSLAGTYVGAFLYWTLAVLEAGLPSLPLLALPRLCLLLGL